MEEPDNPVDDAARKDRNGQLERKIEADCDGEHGRAKRALLCLEDEVQNDNRSRHTHADEGKIPWHIPGEQTRFKEITWGHSLIMGRNTHESIGRPLPGRQNVVVTRNPEYFSPGCTIVHSLQEAYDLCQSEDKVFNIGGEQLYRQGLAQANKLILTVLKEDITGDAFFPYFSTTTFERISRENIAGSCPYEIRTYVRKVL